MTNTECKSCAFPGEPMCHSECPSMVAALSVPGQSDIPATTSPVDRSGTKSMSGNPTVTRLSGNGGGYDEPTENV